MLMSVSDKEQAGGFKLQVASREKRDESIQFIKLAACSLWLAAPSP